MNEQSKRGLQKDDRRGKQGRQGEGNAQGSKSRRRERGSKSPLEKSPTYTHQDKEGVRWRFAGGRPVSELADQVHAKVGWPLDR